MNLRDFLRSEYGYPAGNGAPEALPIRIDDQCKSDCYRAFCQIAVTVPRQDQDIFVLTLSNVPWDEHVEARAEELNGCWSRLPYGRRLTLELSARGVSKVRRLAHAIDKVTGRGRTYLDSNWKWMTRRTAGSLDQFADRLKRYTGVRCRTA